MENYELTLVLSGNATAAKENSTNTMVEKLVKTFKGNIKRSDKWGKIDLAYPIKKNITGVFMYYEIELSPDSASGLKQKINQEETIIRYLMVQSHHARKARVGTDHPKRKVAAGKNKS